MLYVTSQSCNQCKSELWDELFKLNREPPHDEAFVNYYRIYGHCVGEYKYQVHIRDGRGSILVFKSNDLTEIAHFIMRNRVSALWM